MILIIIIAIAVPLILVINRNRKRKFILNYGFYYNNIKNLCQKYKSTFVPFKRNITKKHYAKSKKALDNLDFNTILIYYLENNMEGFRTNFENIAYNKKLLLNYTTEYNNVMKYPYIYSNEIINASPFKSANNLIEYEKKMLKQFQIKDTFEIMVETNAYYSSPKGKNHYSRRAKHNYNDISYCYREWKNSTRYKVSAAYERSLMTESLRYDILKRDNYRCRICGATASDGVKLHVDHIIPVSKGGKTTPNNLQTLCERCNLGKSNKM